MYSPKQSSFLFVLKENQLLYICPLKPIPAPLSILILAKSEMNIYSSPLFPHL